MTNDEHRRRDLLALVPIFSSLGQAELNHVAQLTEEHAVADGEIVVHEGQGDRAGFFVVADGCVEVTRGGERIAVLNAGGLFGELALLRRSPRSATVTATAPTRLLAIDRRDFQAMLLEHPTVAVRMLEVLAERLHAAEERLD